MIFFHSITVFLMQLWILLLNHIIIFSVALISHSICFMNMDQLLYTGSREVIWRRNLHCTHTGPSEFFWLLETDFRCSLWLWNYCLKMYKEVNFWKTFVKFLQYMRSSIMQTLESYLPFFQIQSSQIFLWYILTLAWYCVLNMLFVFLRYWSSLFLANWKIS